MPAKISPSRSRRTQTERRAEARASLIEAAIQLLSAKGAAGASLLAIAQEAGVSKSAALHHFPSKAALFGAVVEEVWSRNRHALAPYAADARSNEHTLRSFLETAWNAYKEPYSMASLEVLLDSRSIPEARALFFQITLQARQQYLSLLCDILRRAGIRTENAELVYTIGIAVFRGLAVENAINPRPFIETVAYAFIDMIAHADIFSIEVETPAPTMPSSEPPPQSSMDTRSRLILAAIECLFRDGYARTSLIDVAALAGVAKSTSLHHFTDKVALMEGVIQHVWNRNRESYFQAVAGADRGQLLIAFWNSAWSMFRLPPNLADLEIWLAGRSDEELRNRTRSAGEAITQQAEKDFTVLFEMSGFSKRNAPIVYAMGLAALRGLTIECSIGSNPLADSASALFSQALLRSELVRS